MKTLQKIFVVISAIIFSAQAHAVLYLARAYEPNLARWINRDPIGERGGLNLYAFVNNNGIDKIDPLGLKPKSQCQLANGGALLSFTFEGVNLSGSGLSLPAVSGEPIKVVVTKRWEDIYQYSAWVWHSEDVTFDYSVARQKLRNVGPIPEGAYYIENCEERCARTSPYSHIIKWSAWGDYSWSLHAEPETQTYGRSGFFIHGGNRWGSAGCIDLESGDSKLHDLFKGIGNSECCFIPVTVKYDVQQATKSDVVLDNILSAPVGW